MYAMQYEIALPADYDMGIIRHRVAAKARLLDHFEGLGLKAYLIRERGVDGSEVNRYAPFYLWASIAGMNRFLWGGAGFGNIISLVGRIPVRHWTGVACLQGPAATGAPTLATREFVVMPPDIDPTIVVERARDELRERAKQQHVHTVALAVDPLSWTIVRFTLWRQRAADATTEWWQVLHLSTPHFRDILT
jgi:hypothetical protein